MSKRLPACRRKRFAPFKDALAGAVPPAEAREDRRSASAFVQKSFRLGDPNGLDLEKALALAAETEDEEIIRSLASRH
jgi:hypothetical protein